MPREDSGLLTINNKTVTYHLPIIQDKYFIAHLINNTNRKYNKCSINFYEMVNHEFTKIIVISGNAIIELINIEPAREISEPRLTIYKMPFNYKFKYTGPFIINAGKIEITALISYDDITYENAKISFYITHATDDGLSLTGSFSNYDKYNIYNNHGQIIGLV
jgi:hypothetical protein